MRGCIGTVIKEKEQREQREQKENTSFIEGTVSGLV